MKAEIWLKVSVPDHMTENQLRPLREYANRRGLEVVEVFDARRGDFLSEVVFNIHGGPEDR